MFGGTRSLKKLISPTSLACQSYVTGIFAHVCFTNFMAIPRSIPWVVPGRVQQIHGTFASDSVQWCSVGDPSMIQWCSVHRMYPGNKRLMVMAMWDNVGTTPMMGLVQIGDWWTILYLLEPDGHEWDVRYARSRYGTCMHMPVYQSWTCMSFLVLETVLVIVPHTQAPDSLHSTAFDGRTIWPWSRWKIVPQVAKPTVAFRNSPDFLLLSILYVELPIKGKTLPIYV